MSEEYAPIEVSRLIASGEVELIDVREPHEYEAGHIPGSRLIELSRLPSLAATISRERPVVLCCRSGGRSALATQALRSAGYDAHNMAGGMLEWVAAGLEIEPRDGHIV